MTPTPVCLTQNVAALRAQVPAAGKKWILGFSLGGILGLEWAYQHPDEIAGLVLINISLSNSPIYDRMRPGALGRIARFSLVPPGTRRDELSLAMTSGLPVDRVRELAPHWAKRSEEFPVLPQNFFAQIRLAGSARLRPQPPPSPLLLLASGRDQVVHPRCSTRIAKAWGVPLKVHEDAGHDLSLSHPEWLLEQLRDWQALRPTPQQFIDRRGYGDRDAVNP